MSVYVSSGRRVPVTSERKAWPLAGIERPRSYSSSNALQLIGTGLNASYASIYASQPWIYSLVNKLARGIARLPAKSYSIDPATGERDRLREHALPILLSRPYPRGSRFKLFEATVGSLAIYGNALWWKYRQRPGQPPIELWPLDWRYITIRSGDDVPVAHYEYRGPGGVKKFLPDDVVHFQWWSPSGSVGTSPLEPLRVTLALEDAGRRYAVASFANGVRPSGAWVTAETLEEQQREELRAEIEAAHGGPDNQFRMMLLDGGLDWKSFAHTAQEAETIAHRKLNQVEACAVYDIPPPVVAILDRATFSNITEQNKALYREAYGPWLTLLEETVAAQLLWGESDFANTFVEFDLAEPLRADIGERADAYMKMSHVRTPNEMRDDENLPRIDDPAADAIYVPLNHIAVGAGQTAEEQIAKRLELLGPARQAELTPAPPSEEKTREVIVLALPQGAEAKDGDTAAAIAELAKAVSAIASKEQPPASFHAHVGGKTKNTLLYEDVLDDDGNVVDRRLVGSVSEPAE